MADSLADQDVDALVSVIESLQERIRRDGGVIGANEIRTRTALIDPLFNALGWNTADPAMVIPEYAAGGGAADYALLKVLPEDGSPVIAFIEAKRLGEPLEGHRAQMLTYANMEGVRYVGLTNGDRWELYDVFKEARLDERRILDVSLRRESAFDCAVKLLPLAWPGLETGEAFSSQNAQRLLNQAIQASAAPSVVALLIDRGAGLSAWNDQGGTPLHLAARDSSNPEVVALLIDRAADITATTQGGRTPLHAAASGNPNPEAIALLIDRGADIMATDENGWTPLHDAANGNSNPEVVALLIDQGAGVAAATNFGVTPLHLAAGNNPNPEVVSLLLKRGVDIETRGNLGTPLHAAAQNSNPEVVRLLIDRGADTTAKDSQGFTPLHLAAWFNSNPEVVSLLLDHGADVTAVDSLGFTPLDYALRDSKSEVIALLIDRGAGLGAWNDQVKTPYTR